MHSKIIEQFVADIGLGFASGDVHAASKKPESETVQTVQNLYRAVVRGDVDAFQDALADDIEFETIGPADIPFVGCWKGRTEVVETVQRNLSQIADQRPEVVFVAAQGSKLVVHGRETGRFLPTGRSYAMHWVQTFELRDGRLARIRQVFDSVPLRDAIADQG